MYYPKRNYTGVSRYEHYRVLSSCPLGAAMRAGLFFGSHDLLLLWQHLDCG